MNEELTYEELLEKAFILVDRADTLIEENKELRRRLEQYERSSNNDFYTDDDYVPGSIRMNFRKGERPELITSPYKTEFEGIRFHSEPGRGFGIKFVTKKTPR